MSTEDLWSSFLSEAAKPDLPFFPPLPQADAPPPESFDTEFEGLEFEGVELPEDSFLQFRGNTPVFISPSVFTHSTESGYDLAASEYSYGYPHSNYSMPLDIAFQNVRVSSEYGGVDTLQNPAYPPFNDLSSFGALPPTPSPSPPLRMGKAQSDYGPSKSRQPHFGVAPDNLSLSRQQPATPTVPPVPPVLVSDKQGHAGHGKAHQCPNCSRGKVIEYKKVIPAQFSSQLSHAHSTSRHIWIRTTQRESSNMCAHTVAASVRSVVNMTFNATVQPYTGTNHPHHYTQIHPGFRIPPLVLLLAAELGATSVARGVLGVREVVIASTSSEG